MELNLINYQIILDQLYAVILNPLVINQYIYQKQLYYLSYFIVTPPEELFIAE